MNQDDFCSAYPLSFNCSVAMKQRLNQRLDGSLHPYAALPASVCEISQEHEGLTTQAKQEADSALLSLRAAAQELLRAADGGTTVETFPTRQKVQTPTVLPLY